MREKYCGMKDGCVMCDRLFCDGKEKENMDNLDMAIMHLEIMEHWMGVRDWFTDHDKNQMKEWISEALTVLKQIKEIQEGAKGEKVDG